MSPPRVSLALALAALLAASVSARKKGVEVETFTVEIPALPADLAGFLALRDRLAKTPQGGVAVYIVAGILYTRDEGLGSQAMTVALQRKHLSEAKGGYKGWAPSRSFGFYLGSLRQKPYLPAQFIQGTTPENGYALPPPPFRIEMFTNPHSDLGEATRKLFVRTRGADNPKPFQVTANNRGIWKVSGSGSSLFSGTRPPVVVEDDDL